MLPITMCLFYTVLLLLLNLFIGCLLLAFFMRGGCQPYGIRYNWILKVDPESRSVVFVYRLGGIGGDFWGLGIKK